MVHGVASDDGRAMASVMVVSASSCRANQPLPHLAEVVLAGERPNEARRPSFWHNRDPIRLEFKEVLRCSSDGVDPCWEC